MNRMIGVGIVSLSLISCAGSSNSAARGHSLQLDVTLTPNASGQVSFLSPSNTIISYPAAGIVGKPYLVAAFHAGFTPGTDPPIDHAWGTIPSNLTVSWVTPSTYANGPYDVVFVIYTNTPITSAIESGPAQSSPAAAGGDLASFSLDESVVHTGDPKNALGTIRFNVDNADVETPLANRTPADATNSTEISAAFNNTILTIP